MRKFANSSPAASLPFGLLLLAPRQFLVARGLGGLRPLGCELRRVVRWAPRLELPGLFLFGLLRLALVDQARRDQLIAQ